MTEETIAPEETLAPELPAPPLKKKLNGRRLLRLQLESRWQVVDPETGDRLPYAFAGVKDQQSRVDRRQFRGVIR